MNSNVFLFLATEWFSRKGGVSTFNRELCRAVRAAGHTVYCAVPTLHPEEDIDARKSGVQLIHCVAPPGAPPHAGLYRRIPFRDAVYPDVIIGHGRITGPAALTQIQDNYGNALRLHVVHVAPGEIEPWKGGQNEHTNDRSELRERVELELAVGADLVVAVGPRLYAEYKTLLFGQESHTRIHQLNPGIILRPPPKEQPPQLRCLMLGRAEDLKLKGLDIASLAVSRVSSQRLGQDPILVIRGAPPGTGNELLQTLAAIPGVLRNRLRVMEYTDDVQRLSSDIRAASVVIMPSRAEGFGLVGLEAISIGVPALLSQQSGLSGMLLSEIRERALPLIVPVTGDLTTDAVRWADEIEIVLNRRKDAFDRVHRLGTELASVLSWDFAVKSLVTVIDEVYATKHQESPKDYRNLQADRSSGPISSESHRLENIEFLRQVRRRALLAILDSQTRWGPSLFSSSPKVANVCEVLLAIHYDSFEYSSYSRILIEAIEWLFGQQRQGGFPSLSRDTITTHCTALGALACACVASWNHIPVELRARAEQASRLAADACLRMAGDRGWGTWGRGTVRLQPTILALRALALHDVHRPELSRRFEQLRVMHSKGKPGCFGFQPGTDPRISPTAAFLLLCYELDRLGYMALNTNRFQQEKFMAAQFLVSQLMSSDPELAEVELYYVDPEYVPLIGHVEQMTWIHVSIPLAIEALARHPELIGTTEAEHSWFKAALDLASRFDADSRLLQGAIFSEFGLTEPIFPTAYGCMALQAVDGWLQHYRTLPDKVPVPPPVLPESTIRKAGAAIVDGGLLLLVRKFGTDQLIMPGGAIEEGEETSDALRRELMEELGTGSEIPEQPIGIYKASAAFEPGLEVEITLYLAKLIKSPVPSSEIEEIVWYSPLDTSAVLSPIVKDCIVPSLRAKGII